MTNTVGVLALQGAYQKHLDSLARLGIAAKLVRKAEELADCDEELWMRFPQFREKVLEMQQEYFKG